MPHILVALIEKKYYHHALIVELVIRLEGKPVTSTNYNHQTRLLLVDDEQDILTIMKSGLEKAGYFVDTFNDPRQALDHYKPDYYDRILTDIRMPNMNGFEFARAIFAKDADAQICFLSSFEILEDEARKVFSNLPSYCFIRKPITPSKLVEHLLEHNHKV